MGDDDETTTPTTPAFGDKDTEKEKDGAPRDEPQPEKKRRKRKWDDPGDGAAAEPAATTEATEPAEAPAKKAKEDDEDNRVGKEGTPPADGTKDAKGKKTVLLRVSFSSQRFSLTFFLCKSHLKRPRCGSCCQIETNS